MAISLVVWILILSSSIFAGDPKVEFFEEDGQQYIRVDIDPFVLSEESEENTPILLINNETAGNGKYKPKIRELRNFFYTHNIQYDEILIDRKLSVEENSKRIFEKIQALNRRFNKPIGIVISGGDGTYTKVTSGILNHCNCLTEIPEFETFDKMIAFIAAPPKTGSANDIGNIMGSSKNMEKYVEALEQGPILPIRFPLLRKGPEDDPSSISFHLETGGDLSGSLFQEAEKTKGDKATWITRRWPRLSYFYGLPIAIIKATTEESIFHYKLTVRKNEKVIATEENESILYGLASLPILGSIGTVDRCRSGTGEINPQLMFINVRPIRKNKFVQVIQRMPFLFQLFGTKLTKYVGFDPYKSKFFNDLTKRVSLVDQLPIEGTSDTVITIEVTKKIHDSSVESQTDFAIVSAGENGTLQQVEETTGNVYYEKIIVSFPDRPNAKIRVSRTSHLFKEHEKEHVTLVIQRFENLYKQLEAIQKKQGYISMKPGEKTKIIIELEKLINMDLKKEERRKIEELISRFKSFFKAFEKIIPLPMRQCRLF